MGSAPRVARSGRGDASRELIERELRELAKLWLNATKNDKARQHVSAVGL